MNETIKTARKWIKEHKKEITITLCVGVTTICGVILFKNSKKPAVMDVKKTFEDELWPEKLNIPDLGIGKLDDIMKYPNGTVELWLDNIPLADLGNLGDAIADQIPDIPGDNNVWALLSVKPNNIG